MFVIPKFHIYTLKYAHNLNDLKKINIRILYKRFEHVLISKLIEVIIGI